MAATPDDGVDLADDEGRGHGPPVAAVERVATTVTHHEVVVRGNGGGRDVGRRLGADPHKRWEPGLGQRLPVDEHGVPRRGNGLAGKADDPFHQIGILLLRVGWNPLEDHDVSALDGGVQFVNGNPVPDLERGRHRARRNRERLDGVGPSGEGHHENDDHRQDPDDDPARRDPEPFHGRDLIVFAGRAPIAPVWPNRCRPAGRVIDESLQVGRSSSAAPSAKRCRASCSTAVLTVRRGRRRPSTSAAADRVTGFIQRDANCRSVLAGGCFRDGMGGTIRPLRCALLGASMLVGVSTVTIGVQPAVGAVGPVSRRDAAGVVWLCRPGIAANPCTANENTTVVSSDGSTSIQPAHPAIDPAVDCFYAYPTVSTEKMPNANLTVQPTETTAAVQQASRFSQVCRVWAPMYRQRTVASLATGLGGHRASTTVAYNSLLAGWRDYLSRYNDKRPIVLIGHSQ